MEYELTVEELEDIIDNILDEEMMESLDENMLQTILFEELDESSNESMSDAVKEFLANFDKRANEAIEKKMLDKIAQKYKVDPKELLKVVGV